MKTQNKVQSDCDVKVSVDRGSLRLGFPKRHAPLWELMDGKSLKGKPKYLYLGKAGLGDNPEDWKRASQIAIAMEADLDHQEWEKLFDRSLAKYGLEGLLGGKYAKLADVLPMPGVQQSELEITVGEMWEAYLEWKKTVVEETTFRVHYATMYSNAIEGKIWNNKLKNFSVLDCPLKTLRLNSNEVAERLASVKLAQKKALVAALTEAFNYCKTKRIIQCSTTQNPFLVLNSKYASPSQTTQDKYASKIVNGELKEWHEIQDEKALEEDRRAFTKEERDVIVRAFYDSSKMHAFYAPLIEFYFLTGCRTSEAIALTWNDINFERRIIRFSKSLGASTRKIKESKTGEVRLFYFHPNSQLECLLLRLKKNKTTIGKLVFPNKKDKHLQIPSICQAWRGCTKKKTLLDGTKKEYYYPGIVRQLADEGKISGYLPQYHTRHTYITLTAQANRHNTNALLYIASACGNSVDVILKHYLGQIEDTKIVEA